MSSFELLQSRAANGAGFAPLAPRADRIVTERPERVFPDLGLGGDDEALAGAATPEAVQEDTAARERAGELHAAYERGLAAGRAACEERVRGELAALGEALAEVARFRATLLERYHDELLEIALEVAGKVVRRELEAHPEHWIGMIREGIGKTLARERIRVRVGAALHGFLAQHLAELRAGLDEVKELELTEEPTLAPSGCVIETSFGDVDLGIDGQLDAMRSALLEPA